jgi:hypothetical protein
MLQKMKMWLEKRQQLQAKRKELNKYKQYYQAIKNGALFLQFVKKDLALQKANQINRDQRRRFERMLDTFELKEELVIFYKTKIDAILSYIEKELHPPKAGTVKIDNTKIAEIKKESK